MKKTNRQKIVELVGNSIFHVAFIKKDGDTTKFIFLENGIQDWHKNGKKLKEYKWSIVNGQIRVDYHPDAFWVFRINTDKSITLIANVNHEHKLHQDYPKNLQQTFKKIK